MTTGGQSAAGGTPPGEPRLKIYSGPFWPLFRQTYAESTDVLYDVLTRSPTSDDATQSPMYYPDIVTVTATVCGSANRSRCCIERWRQIASKVLTSQVG
jgi:hypothetical protein